MPPKRMRREEGGSSSSTTSTSRSKKVKTTENVGGGSGSSSSCATLVNSTGNNNANAASTNRPNAAPKTIKDRILAIVASSDDFVSLQSIKKRLVQEYNMQESKSFNTNVNKSLKNMIQSGVANFGKVGGSYHSGITSNAYLRHQAKEAAAAEMLEREQKGEIQCPHCKSWNGFDAWLREDSVARGSLNRCLNPDCKREYWSWIADIYGHTVEYRYRDAVTRAEYRDDN